MLLSVIVEKRCVWITGGQVLTCASCLTKTQTCLSQWNSSYSHSEFRSATPGSSQVQMQSSGTERQAAPLERRRDCNLGDGFQIQRITQYFSPTTLFFVFFVCLSFSSESSIFNGEIKFWLLNEHRLVLNSKAKLRFLKHLLNSSACSWATCLMLLLAHISTQAFFYLAEHDPNLNFNDENQHLFWTLMLQGFSGSGKMYDSR